MKYIRSLTQQRLCLMLAVYIGLFLNGAVLFRRVEGYLEHLTVRNGIFAAIEVFGSVLATFFLLRLLSLFGRRTWQILASLVVIISAAASYYMTFMNVVIGYGIVASVMTTDIDLSKEVVGKGFIVWTVLTCLIPLFFIWSNTCRYTLLRQLRTRGQRIRNIAVVILAALLVWAPIRLMEKQQKRIEKATGVDMPSYGGVVANSYLPSNWISALGLYAWAQADESSDVKSLINPMKNSVTKRRVTNSMIPMLSLLLVKRRAGIIWASSVMTGIPRQNWRRKRTWWLTGGILAIPQPSSRCVVCLFVKAVPVITHSVP